MVVNDCWSTPFIITFKHVQVYKSLISQITGKISADMPMYRKHEVREGKHTYGTYLFEGLLPTQFEKVPLFHMGRYWNVQVFRASVFKIL